VAADRALNGLTEIEPQVPPVGGLNGAGRAAGAAVGVDPGPVTADRPGSRPGRQRGGERVRGPLGEDVDRPARLDVDQQRAVAVPLPQGELVHAQHPRRHARSRVGQGPDQPDQRHPATAAANRPDRRAPARPPSASATASSTAVTPGVRRA
jgi:hypothetical protein